MRRSKANVFQTEAVNLQDEEDHNPQAAAVVVVREGQAVREAQPEQVRNQAVVDQENAKKPAPWP